MTFRDLLLRAKAGDDDAITELLEIYRPLLIRTSFVNGVFNEDLFQEQCITLLRCIALFNRMDE